MLAELTFGGHKLRVALDRGVSLAIPVDFTGAGPRHFGAPPPASRPYAVGNFSGSVATGASCNCSTLTLIPHCQMTHTEASRT
jgi:arylformamidase